MVADASKVFMSKVEGQNIGDKVFVFNEMDFVKMILPLMILPNVQGEFTLPESFGE